MKNVGTTEEAKEAIRKAGMLLDDGELSQVSGGIITEGDMSGTIQSVADKQKSTYYVYIKSKNKCVEAFYHRTQETLAVGKAVIVGQTSKGEWRIKLVSKK